jgi:hypothetical protein
METTRKMLRDWFLISILFVMVYALASCKSTKKVQYLSPTPIRIESSTHEAVLIHKAELKGMEIITFRDSTTGAKGTLYKSDSAQSLIIDCPPVDLMIEPQIVFETQYVTDWKAVLYISLLLSLLFGVVLNKLWRYFKA